MKLAFDSEITAVANNHRLMVKKFGESLAGILRRRLDDLAAAESLQDMRWLPGKIAIVSHTPVVQFSIQLSEGFCLLLTPDRTFRGDMLNGWAEIKAVRIIGVKQ